ncbi:MAG TPA: glutaredoxin family protein [Steroidobacteraceae bacterium]|nr:glutaredoxin family protein [Steroidobacteraceae bacterium]
MPRWTVYSRADCSLCERLCEELAGLLGPAAAATVQVVDIDGTPELEQKYGTRIPVLLADGEFVCAYRLDPQRVQAWLQRSG